MNARSIALFGVLAFCAVTQAKTIAWYRFEEKLVAQIPECERS